MTLHLQIIQTFAFFPKETITEDVFFIVLTERGRHFGNNLITSLQINFADLSLNTLVKSPVEIKQGDNALLNVEKSTSGSLTWTRQGYFVRGEEDSHHIYLNSDKTELEIVAASPEMAGIYEVLLKQGNCEIRKAIEVQIKGL